MTQIDNDKCSNRFGFPFQMTSWLAVVFLFWDTKQDPREQMRKQTEGAQLEERLRNNILTGALPHDGYHNKPNPLN